jgi:HEAT repeat protein
MKGGYVRQEAAQALGKIGDARTAEPLIQAVKDELIDTEELAPVLEQLGVRWEAVPDIGKMIHDARTVESLIDHLKPSDIFGKPRDIFKSAEAAKDLGRIGGAKAVQVLVETWKKDERYTTPSEEVQLLSPLNSPRQQSVFMREEAREALLKIGESALIKILKHPQTALVDVYQRAAAAQALCLFNDARAIGALVEALKDEYLVREGAEEALREIGDERAVGPLIQVLKDEDYQVRKVAAKILGEIADARAVEPLIQALRDEDPGVRVTAAEALGEIGHEMAVEPLIQALKDKYEVIRGRAAVSLGKIGDVRAVGPLTQALKDKDSDVRESAKWALARVREKKI